MNWGNCWFYVLPKWLKNPKRTYLIVRLTRESWFPVPHVMFAESIDGLEVTEFKPSEWTKRKIIFGPLGWFFRLLPIYKFWFHGRTRTGPGEERKK